jgi:hypothetical protein
MSTGSGAGEEGSWYLPRDEVLGRVGIIYYVSWGVPFMRCFTPATPRSRAARLIGQTELHKWSFQWDYFPQKHRQVPLRVFIITTLSTVYRLSYHRGSSTIPQPTMPFTSFPVPIDPFLDSLDSCPPLSGKMTFSGDDLVSCLTKQHTWIE